jgi:hypothetical protein
MGRTAYSSADRAYPFLQEESEPSEAEMQGRRDSNPRGIRFWRAALYRCKEAGGRLRPSRPAQWSDASTGA